MSLTNITASIPKWLASLDIHSMEKLYGPTPEAGSMVAKLHSPEWEEDWGPELIKEYYGYESNLTLGIPNPADSIIKEVREEFSELGYIDEKLLSSMSEDDKCMCHFRIIVPKDDELRETFRIEVVTTPDDSQIIVWCLITD
jgi:hypothetical protein